MPDFVVQNFGCRASQADGAVIETQLKRSGLTCASDAHSASLVVLNTCTVTEAADDELRHIVRRVHRTNPEAKIVITGCYAQRAPEELASLPGVHLVVGNSDKTRLVELLTEPYHGQIQVTDVSQSSEFQSCFTDEAPAGRARPNLKIQDGCSNRCSFCIIPSVRGRSRSAPVQQVIEQIRALAQHYPEVVLTGINLGRWGREGSMQTRLVELLRMVLDETNVQRLRLSSVEPMDWSRDLLEFVAGSSRIAQHIHAPLQSGSDAVLRRMCRKYRRKHYIERLRLAHSLMPDAAIGADVMAGFPGETQGEFEETVELVEELPFTYLHVFPYSERPGTPAAACEQLAGNVRKERGRLLKQIAHGKNQAFRERMLGRKLSAVTLLNGTALTTNYITVELTGGYRPKQLIDVALGKITATGVQEAMAFPVLA